jgi:hypothetical protein
VHARQGGLPLPVAPAYRTAMPTKDDDRAHRLAEKLRENLKRRKAQARGTADDGEAKPSPEPSAPTRPQP